MQTYFEQVIPRLFSMLHKEPDAQQVSPAHKRAAAFTLSRLLAPDFRHVRISRAIILRTLHLPLLSVSESPSSPYMALQLLIALVSRMDPSPPLLSTLLSPIVPALATLLEHFSGTRATDPELRVSVHGIFIAWGRVMSHEEATDRLWAVVLGAGGTWEGTNETLHAVEPPQDDVLPSPEALLMPAEQTGDMHDGLLQGNVFMLRPDPAQFVSLLRDVGRDDITAALFIRALEACQSTHHGSTSSQTLETQDVDPRKYVVHLDDLCAMGDADTYLSDRYCTCSWCFICRTRCPLLLHRSPKLLNVC